MSGAQCPAAIVGAGPVGLTAALLLAARGIPSILIDRRPPPPPGAVGPTYREGSRAVVTQRSSLDAWSAGDPRVVDALLGLGVTWTRKETWHRDRLLFVDEYRTSPGQPPPFVNVPQPTVEAALRRAVVACGLVDVRWGTTVLGVRQDDDRVLVDTSGGTVATSWLVAADGARSTVRAALGVRLPCTDSRHWFVIADVRDASGRFPFDPRTRRFHYGLPDGGSGHLLVMPQPDGVWRLDWQSPQRRDLDRDLASGLLHERIDRIVGGAPATVEWVSQYRFQNGVADTFLAGRVLLAGDAAHRLSPFGGRGMNSGVSDAAAAAAAVARSLATPRRAALETGWYALVRRQEALENVAATSRVLSIMEPVTGRDRARRRLAIARAARSGWARRYLDNGAYRPDPRARQVAA